MIVAKNLQVFNGIFNRQRMFGCIAVEQKIYAGIASQISVCLSIG